MGRKIVLTASFLLVVAACSSVSDDPFAGTWALNLANSDYSGLAAPQSMVVTFDAQGDGYNLVIEDVDSEGTERRSTWPLHFDGRDYPAQQNMYNDVDTFSSLRIDAHTISYVFKKNGKEVGRRQASVSADGETLTTTASYEGANGKAVNITEVFDRQ